MKPTLALLSILASAAPFAAQQTLETWGPEQAPLGCPVHYSLVNAGIVPLTYFPCAFAVYDAAGALVFTPSCAGPVVLQPHEFFVHTWPQVDASGQPVPPGTYHLNHAAGPSVVVGGADAAVAPIGSRQFELCAPQDAGFCYVLAASFSNTVGIPSCAGRIPLDLDPLLRLSLTRPNAFPGFAGVLDASGQASARIVLPANNLRAFGIVLSFVVLDPASPCEIRRISAPTVTTIL